MDNTASRKEIRRKEKAVRQAERESGEVIISLMSYRAGRNWVWDQLSYAHVFITSYSPDALQTAFAEGERNSGLRLLDTILTWCPEQFTEMMREQNERRNQPEPDSGDAESFPDDDDGVESIPGSDVYDP